MSSLRPAKVRFGPFELDVRLGELHKRGLRIRLPEQPFTILLMLLEREGDLVSRDEIRNRLWPRCSRSWRISAPTIPRFLV